MQTKKWYQSKMIWYAIATGVAGITAAVQAQYPDIAVLATANSAVMIALRMMTNTEIR